MKEWKKSSYIDKLQGKILYVTTEDKCYSIGADGSEEVLALRSTQEEADGRLLLHAAHAASAGYKSVVINSEDTDVFILCLAFCESIQASLYMKCGTKSRKRVLDIEKIACTLGNQLQYCAKHLLVCMLILAVMQSVLLLAKGR